MNLLRYNTAFLWKVHIRNGKRWPAWVTSILSWIACIATAAINVFFIVRNDQHEALVVALVFVNAALSSFGLILHVLVFVAIHLDAKWSLGGHVFMAFMIYDSMIIFVTFFTTMLPLFNWRHSAGLIVAYITIESIYLTAAILELSVFVLYRRVYKQRRAELHRQERWNQTFGAGDT